MCRKWKMRSILLFSVLPWHHDQTFTCESEEKSVRNSARLTACNIIASAWVRFRKVPFRCTTARVILWPKLSSTIALNQ